MSISSEITRINTNIANAYTAMEAKGATLPATQNSANLASTVNTITGGGVDIQGIIEEYEVASGGNVSAGDFVKFIENYSGSNTKLEDNISRGYVISAVQLNSNKVFIAHSINSDSNKYLYGIVCTISGTTITAGTDTSLSMTSYTGNVISAVALSEDKVFIAHSINSSNYQLSGIVCTISETTITKGTDTELSSGSGTGTIISAVALSESSVFIAHSSSSGSSRYLYGIVCTISGTTITAGTDTSLSGTKYTGYAISAVALSEDKVFIAHTSGSTYYLFRIICTISGTTITKGTDTRISTQTAQTISAVALSENKVFIAHKSGTSSFNIYGVIVTISGSTIVAGTDTSLSSSSNYTGYVISVVKLDTDKVFIAQSTGNTDARKLYGIICTISGTTITAGTDTQLSTQDYSGYAISAVALSEDKVFIAYSYGSGRYLYGMIGYQVTVNTLSNVNEIGGIAKEAGTAGDTIEVYVPDI